MRRRRAPLKAVKELDVFPKVSDDYQRSTARGGTFSIISIALIIILVVSEFFYYRSTELKFKYSVDTDMDSLLQFNLDMTIAMPCNYLGADVVDLAGESKMVTPFMMMEPALFELSDYQEQIFKAKRELLDRFSESRSLNDFPVIENLHSLTIANKNDPNGDIMKKTSCRIHGKMEVKKVAGNFHVTVGRSVAHPQGHAHLNIMVPKDIVNFSHRIDHFSFGPPVPGGINPLDSTLKISEDRYHMFQYYIQVVPTKFSTLDRSMNTNQFSVTERNRTINHRKGSHGVSGIFFKFDMNAMSVEIVERRRSFWQFLIRLCGIVGGIFATSGMLHSLIGSLTDGVLCKLFRTKKAAENELVSGSNFTTQYLNGVTDPSPEPSPEEDITT